MPRLRLSIPASISAHKHKLAVTAASCTAVTGAVIGALATNVPAAQAATAPAAAQRAAVHAAAHVSASASPSAAATSAKPSATPSTAASTKAAVATSNVAAPATTKATQAAAPATTKSDPYAGLSAYQIAEQIVPSGQFGCFDWVVTRESGWSITATNASSGAYGLGQALPGSKMASEGSDWRTNPVTQIKWVLSYMDGRYGSPCAAQSFWESHNWY